MKKKLFSIISVIMAVALCLGACGKNGGSDEKTNPDDETNITIVTDAPSVKEEKNEDTVPEKSDEVKAEQYDKASLTMPTDTDRFIELAVNVYYNDSECGYYSNEAGTSAFITGEGKYSLSFDCEKDLSADAEALGVKELKNLTAIYLLDMGVGEGRQSTLKKCNILFNEVIVNGESLTVTQTEPKSAFKGTGVFDTNDPINGWDGSLVKEIDTDTANHVANFSTISNPTNITIVFTLSDMVWDNEEDNAGEEAEDTAPVITTGANDSVFSTLDFSSMNAITLTKYLGNGINLGNTMEAYGHSTLGIFASVSSYETYWGQPKTTAKMIQGMKAAGFDTIRIPVAWTNTMNYENGDYTIRADFMDRVEEIVNYALDAEMFVIVNDHWDGGWWGRFGSSDPAVVAAAHEQYKSMWTQIAERFKDYSPMLIFESANEELGNSLNDNTECPTSGSLSKDGCFEMTNLINQEFVDTIRSTGGNNSDRFLLIAGYNTDFEMTCDDRYHMPKDTVDGKLLLSVHYYTPWNYCGAENQARWGIKSELETMNGLLSSLTKFTDKGYGIIIGEYGALPLYDSDTRTYTLKTNTDIYTSNFLDNCDLFNYCPVLWSCNDFFNRNKCEMFNEDVAALFSERSYAKELESGDAYIENVKASMAARMEAAPDMWDDVETYEPGTPVAWIMWNGGAGTYSVGDIFNPADNTAGITATNAIVDGAGEYTVSLDFAGGNDGLTFAALAIADCEILYPNNVILIESITYDDKPATLLGTPYTNSDNGKCTRVNLINEWITQLPADARCMGSLKNATPVLLDKTELVGIHNITIKFRLIVK